MSPYIILEKIEINFHYEIEKDNTIMVVFSSIMCTTYSHGDAL